MSEREMMNAQPYEGVATGSCVMLEDEGIVYAGPFKGSPPPDGKIVLMNPADFEKFKAIVDRGRH